MHLFVIHIASNFFSHFKRQIICPLAFFSYFIGVLKIFQVFSKNIPIFFNCPFPNSLEKTLHIAIGLSLANYAQKNQQKTKFKNTQVRALHDMITETCMYCQKHFLQPSQLTDHFESYHDQCSGLDRKVSKSSHLI